MEAVWLVEAVEAVEPVWVVEVVEVVEVVVEVEVVVQDLPQPLGRNPGVFFVPIDLWTCTGMSGKKG